MFINSQYHIVMKTFKKFSLAVIGLIWVFVLSSCSTTSTLPYDDVYYTPNGNSSNQQTAKVNDDIYSSPSTTGDYQSYYKGESSGVEQVAVGDVSEVEYYSEGGGSGEDIYYDSDYESRIKRFSNEGSSFGYYDDYYTDDYNCNCGGSSNWNVSLGFGFGYGYGYYGWGYPSYGWGYPYYGWGGSYWNGYNNGYWNGYWDGYYGGGYYGDGGYYSGISYGPRGGRSGGTNVPRTGSRGGTDRENPSYREKTVVAGGGAFGSRSGGGNVTNGSGTQGQKSRPAESVRVKNENVSADTKVQSRDNAVKQKPDNRETVQNRVNTQKENVRYDKPAQSGKTSTRSAQTKYDKPKSYRSLPSQKPRSENKYVAPKRNSQTKTNSRSDVRTTTRKPVNQPNRNYNRTTTRNSGSSVRSNTSRSNTTSPQRTTRSSSPKRSYSTPSRSSSPSRSYSSPSRSSSSSSRSYSSPSRSSSSRSSGTSSRSSSSRSSSGGGRR